MAKGLKVGDKVTVNKDVIVDKDTLAHKNGLLVVEPGRLGVVVTSGSGRSAIVDFDGNQIQISYQRLKLVSKSALTKPGRRGRPKGSTTKKTKQGYRSSNRLPTDAAIDKLNYASPQFAAMVANKLLMSGAELASDTAKVEIRLSELPIGIQNEIKQLLQQKLSLGFEKSQSPKKSSKRGRPRAKTS